MNALEFYELLYGLQRSQKRRVVEWILGLIKRLPVSIGSA